MMLEQKNLSFFPGKNFKSSFYLESKISLLQLQIRHYIFIPNVKFVYNKVTAE